MPTIAAVNLFTTGEVHVTDTEGFGVFDLEGLSPNYAPRYSTVREHQHRALISLFNRTSEETTFALRDHGNLSVSLTAEEFCSLLGFREWYWNTQREAAWLPASGGVSDPD